MQLSSPISLCPNQLKTSWTLLINQGGMAVLWSWVRPHFKQRTPQALCWQRDGDLKGVTHAYPFVNGWLGGGDPDRWRWVSRSVQFHLSNTGKRARMLSKECTSHRAEGFFFFFLNRAKNFWDQWKLPKMTTAKRILTENYPQLNSVKVVQSEISIATYR